MLVAGYDVPASDVLDLAVTLRRAADTLEGAVVAGLPDVALTVPDRLAILRALDQPPAGPLAELRGLLLAEHVGRVRDGLV